MKEFLAAAGEYERFGSEPPFPERVHLFAQEEIDAVRAAQAAARSLLLRGEPGTGKSQLAEAVARRLGVPLVRYVVDSKTEARDLFWEIDHVRRLADAQFKSAVADDENAAVPDLALANYVRPGPIWWAFNWSGTKDLPNAAPPVDAPKGWSSNDGVVLLLDEIDKADPDVPNALLEALGDLKFRGPEGETIRLTGAAPFVVITTNDERDLPDAFVRRCLCLRYRLSKDISVFVRFLTARGALHFPKLGGDILREVAELLFADREVVPPGQAKPGLAEYLDFLRVLYDQGRNDAAKQKKLIEVVRPYVFDKFKHVDEDLE